VSINGWYPRLRADGVVASGNAGIWISPPAGEPYQVSPVGTSPIWAAITLVYNRNDHTTQVGNTVLPRAYNEYVGSDSGNWAGFVAVGTGRVDRYNGPNLIASLAGVCAPRFLGPQFGYLQPFQPGADNRRALIIEGQTRAEDVILDWQADRGGRFYVYTVATGTYTRRIMDHKGNDCTIRTQADETPLVAFLGLDDLPWILSGTTNSGTFVRMIYSAFGYVIPGELFYPDARIVGDRLKVVGSTSNGTPRVEWIDFSAPKVDLRLV